MFPFIAMGPDGYTSKEVVYCPDLRESSNRFGICSVKKPRTLSWINTERLRSDIFARISTRISKMKYQENVRMCLI